MSDFRLANGRLTDENERLQSEVRRLEALHQSSRDSQADIDALREQVRTVSAIDISSSSCYTFSTRDKWNKCDKNMPKKSKPVTTR